MYVIIIKWWITKPLKTISLCTISLENNHRNVHCLTPVKMVHLWDICLIHCGIYGMGLLEAMSHSPTAATRLGLCGSLPSHMMEWFIVDWAITYRLSLKPIADQHFDLHRTSSWIELTATLNTRCQINTYLSNRHFSNVLTYFNIF